MCTTNHHPAGDSGGALLSAMPAFVRRRIVRVVSPIDRTATWKWAPGLVLAHKGERRAILACAWDVHGDPVYLIQTGRGRVNVKGAAAANLEYGPVVGQVASNVSLRRAGLLDRAARTASSKRGARTLRARRTPLARSKGAA